VRELLQVCEARGWKGESEYTYESLTSLPVQPSLDELAQWRENVKGASKAKARETIKMEEGDEQMAPVPRTPSRTRVSHSRGSANTDSTTLTTPSSNATSARKLKKDVKLDFLNKV
jgi:hypothetical protein